MAKNLRFSRATMSPKTAAHRKGRQSTKNQGIKRSEVAPAATEVGDAADSSSETGPLPATIAVAAETVDRPENPEGPDWVNEETIGSLDASAAEPVEPAPETTVHAERAKTKRAQLVELLERPDGTSIGEIGEQLGWLPHTVRAALTGLRHAGREVNRDKNAEGRSIYRLSSSGRPLNDAR